MTRDGVPLGEKMAQDILASLGEGKSLEDVSSHFKSSSLHFDDECSVVVAHPRALLKNVIFYDDKSEFSSSSHLLSSSLRIHLDAESITCSFGDDIFLRVSYDGEDSLPFSLDEFLGHLLSLTTEHEGPIGPRELTSLFGIKSPLYFAGIHFLRHLFQERPELSQKFFQKWRDLFADGHLQMNPTLDNDTYNLILNHLYFLLILLMIVVHEMQSCQEDKCLETVSQVSTRDASLLGDLFDDSELASLLLETSKYLSDFVRYLGQCFHDHSLEPTDLFRELYQHLIPLETRQTLGEFYTPPELARLMLDASYQDNMKVLDPACGSGTFIVEALKKALQGRNAESVSCFSDDTLFTSIWGFDVHPLAIITTRVNVFLILNKLLEDPRSGADDIRMAVNCIQKRNFLSLLESIMMDERPRFNLLFDLVIGNPPWFVLNKIDDPSLKLKIKTLARKMNILPSAHQISNLEISSLFFHGSKYFLKKGGMVFLVVSNAFLTGDNHSRTRHFVDFDDIEAWKFDADLFRIHSTCLKARHVPGANHDAKQLQRLEILVKSFVMKSSSSSMQILLKGQETFVPYYIEPVLATKPARNDGHSAPVSGFHVRKFIPKRRKIELLPLGKSYYHSRCFNGAVLGPRNLLFVKVMELMDFRGHFNSKDFVTILPIIDNPKKPWDFNPFEILNIQSLHIERKYIFPVIRSINLVPFLALKYDHVFLPLEPDEKTGGYRFLTDESSHAHHYFQQLDQLYQTYKKTTQSLPTLWSNINYQNKLTASRQRCPYKVVMQGSGTIVKAAVVNDQRVIVDSTNYLVACESLDEAYFLVGVLNAPKMTATIRLIQAEGAGGGGRHIQKRPFTVSIPKYDADDPLHQEISRFARTIEDDIRTHLLKGDLCQEEDGKKKILKPMTVQRLILKRYQGRLRQLDDLIVKILGSQ